MKDGTPVNITYGTAKLWKRTSDRVVRISIPRPSPPGASAFTYGVVYAVVTTAIPSGTKTSPSTAGRVRLTHWNGSAWADAADPVEVVSMMTSSSPVPVGRVVIVGWSGGKWVLVSGSCS